MTIPKLESGSSFTIGNSTMISFVEGVASTLVIRLNGQNKRYLVSEMPLGLAIGLADIVLTTANR